jgi:hypothetical protein
MEGTAFSAEHHNCAQNAHGESKRHFLRDHQFCSSKSQILGKGSGIKRGAMDMKRATMRTVLAMLALFCFCLPSLVWADESPTDLDGDGIPNSEDACPMAGVDGPCGGPVNSNGCPVNDVDGDGICNDQDKCQWTGNGVYGIKYGTNNMGCPLGDADGDSIPDMYDNCASDSVAPT